MSSGPTTLEILRQLLPVIVTIADNVFAAILAFQKPREGAVADTFYQPLGRRVDGDN